MAEAKQRDGCLTAWLVLMIIGNSVTALLFVLFRERIKSHSPNAPAWIAPALTVASAANVVFAVALFRWKKWGFWGLLGTSILAFVTNLIIGTSVLQTILGLLGIGILYFLLQSGDAKRGWTQLE